MKYQSITREELIHALVERLFEPEVTSDWPEGTEAHLVHNLSLQQVILFWLKLDLIKRKDKLPTLHALCAMDQEPVEFVDLPPASPSEYMLNVIYLWDRIVHGQPIPDPSDKDGETLLMDSIDWTMKNFPDVDYGAGSWKKD